VRATFAGLSDLKDPAAVARLRGKDYEEAPEQRSRKAAPAAPAAETPAADAGAAATPAGA
jgi:ribosomal protein L12E/L44/L45/RPP1/RPP2